MITDHFKKIAEGTRVVVICDACGRQDEILFAAEIFLKLEKEKQLIILEQSFGQMGWENNIKGWTGQKLDLCPVCSKRIESYPNKPPTTNF